MLPTGTAGAPSLNLTVALDANNVPTNRINATGVGYDANGNQTQGFAGYTFTYDVANRITAVSGTRTAAYGYDSDNRRIYSRSASGAETIYFYGVDGKKLAAYTPSIITYGGFPEVQLSMQTYNVYFLGKLIYAEGNSVQTDRLGSVRSGGPSGLGYQAQYPYGAEYTLTANDREKYATYTRDSATGLDYAMNRYYASQWGRFLSPDPTYLNVDLEIPQSWNMYAYVDNDPANSNDPTGQMEYICDVNPFLPQCPGMSGPPGGGGGGSPVACAVLGVWPGPVPMDPCGANPGGGGGGPTTNPCPPLPTLPSGIPSNQVALNVQAAKTFYTDLTSYDPEGSAFFSLMGYLTAQFAPGGAWDYKSQYTPGTANYKNAMVFGNFDFGAILQSLGFSYYMTQNAAGVAQIVICNFGGACGTGIPGLQYPFGDQLNDAVDVRKGFNYEAAKQANCK
jgi:RHS repeat-associated protein